MRIHGDMISLTSECVSVHAGVEVADSVVITILTKKDVHCPDEGIDAQSRWCQHSWIPIGSPCGGKLLAIFRVAIATVAVATCMGLIMDSDDQPCVYRTDGIVCYFSDLTAIPAFRYTNASMPWLSYIDLSNNAITSVPTNAFSKVRFACLDAGISLFLRNNLLNDGSFAIGAFNGVTDKLVKLYLPNNNMTTIPAEVGRLTNLLLLSIYGNPIATVDAAVTQSIGLSLTTLFISLPCVKTWPAALYNLRTLAWVQLIDVQLAVPHDAFRSSQATLKKLYLENATQAEISHLACGLENLYELTVVGTTGYKDDTSMSCPLSALKVLSFNTATLKDFSNVFNAFPNLDSFEILTNNISGIDVCDLPGNKPATMFTIAHTEITSIPDIVNDFKALQWCDLRSNRIASIDRHSIRNLPYLLTLRLQMNPIVFVSKCAFVNLPSLDQVELSGTRLTTIPPAVRLLPAVTEVDMSQSRVSCDCRLSWMNQWTPRNHVAFGWSYCENLPNTKLQEFVNTTIASCA